MDPLNNLYPQRQRVRRQRRTRCFLYPSRQKHIIAALRRLYDMNMAFFTGKDLEFCGDTLCVKAGHLQVGREQTPRLPSFLPSYS